MCLGGLPRRPRVPCSSVLKVARLGGGLSIQEGLAFHEKSCENFREVFREVRKGFREPPREKFREKAREKE